jgi:transcription antitermination factor NusG
MAAKWYAIRTKPGYQRMATALEPAADETEEEKIERERRKGESIVERNLRNEGIDVFMPSFWFETKHHRNNRYVERRLPLLLGYAFVNIRDEQYEIARCADGVMCFLKFGREYGPVRFHDRVMEQLVFDDFERRQKFRFEQHSRKEEAKSHRIFELRASLRKVIPKGRGVRINMRAQAARAIETMVGPARERVEAILKELDSLTGDEIDLGKVA